MTSSAARGPHALRRAKILAAGALLSATLTTGAVTVHLATAAEASQESTTSGTAATTDRTSGLASFGRVPAPFSSGGTSSHSSTSGS